MIIIVILVGCPKSISTPGLSGYEAHRYFPLKKGYIWSYLLTNYKEKGTSVIKTEVEEIDGDKIKINSNGSIFYYIRTPEGILKKQAGYYILRKPFVKGAIWEFNHSGFNGKITIIETKPELVVRNITFKNCIVTEEIIEGQNLLLITYYAEGVGPVLIEQYSSSDNKRELILKAELLGYSFAKTSMNSD